MTPNKIFKKLIKGNVLFDSHVHLNSETYDEKMLRSLLKRAGESNVSKIIDMSVNIDSSVKSLDLSSKYSEIYSAIGIDPEVYLPGSEFFNENFDIDVSMDFIDKLVYDNIERVAMIGETGIDNYWLQKNEDLSEDEKDRIIASQTRLFEKHIEIALKYDLPLSIHSRGAVDLCIDIVSDFKGSFGVFHSLTSDVEDEEIFFDQVRRIIDMGFFVGINGICTYKSAKLIRNVYKRIIKEKSKEPELARLFFEKEKSDEDFLNLLYKSGFVIETDGPYLIPSGYSTQYSKINEPSAVKFILQFLKKDFFEV